MAIPSTGWRGDKGGRRGSPVPMSGSPSEEDEGPPPTQRSALDPRTSSDHRRPYSPVAETLFRKDLISAMKLPDNEPLEAEDYWTVTDTWKQEWERGVQVPVKPDGLPEPHVCSSSVLIKSDRFTLPKKLICMNTSGSYKVETHQVTPMVLRAEQVCTYDLDNVDQHWLAALNGERARTGQTNLTETEMERSIEELERQCWEKINSTLRNSDDLETAQDDSIICDVCRSPDSEESNEMVFCDQCNICVHQACYGITTIPSGPWLCRTCVLGIKPPCELCPNKGGAMKSTRTGSKWAHVSCALWIPEVSIGCVEKMEPITKISSIPQSRWSLLCVLCKERMGSCIQCSVKTCKTAYHVTCAFKHNLEMRAIIEDESAEDGVKLRSYCQKHSLNSKKKPVEDSDSESGLGSRKSTMTAEEKSQARRQKMAKVEKEFYKLVDVAVAAKKVQLSEELLDVVYKYWVLKRVAGGNKPLLPPKGEDEVLNALRGEDTERDKMKKLVSIRQDLERVRNLAYMVSRREKISRSFVKLREQILEKQLALLADEEPQNQMSLAEMSAVIEANHGPSVYDKMLSHPDAEQYSHDDFEVIISRIAGEIKDGSSQIRKDNPRLDFRKKSLDTPQKEKLYERIFSDTSQSESDDSFIHNVNPAKSKNKTKKKSLEKGKGSLSKGLRSDSSMSSGEEAAELKKLSPTKNVSSSSKLIYSDSDSDKSETEKTPRGRGRPKKSKLKDLKSHKKTESSSEVRADSDSTQHSLDRPKEFKTKAAMKEFTAADMEAAKKIMEEKKAFAAKNKSKPPYVSSDEESIMEVDADINNDFLLVPQRKAASKAQKKISKVEDKKKKASKASDLFGSSGDESSAAKKTEETKKSPRSSNKKKQTSTDSESETEQVSKHKVKSKSKHSSPSKKEKSKHLSEAVKISPKEKARKGTMDFSFSDSDAEPSSSSRKKHSSSPKKSSKKPSAVDNILMGLSDDSDYEIRPKKTTKADSSEDEALLAAKQASALEYEKQQSGNFDTLFNDTKSKKSQSDSGSDSESGKKKLFDDFENPEVPLFVPQRRAAKKASAQLSEQNLWKKSQQEAYIKELAQIKAKKAAVVDSRGRKKHKSQSEGSRKQRTRSSDSQSSSGTSSSDDSDSDGRDKSPKARGRSPKGSRGVKGSKNQRKPGTKPMGRGKKSPRNKKVSDGKIKSSSALEYLMQRESQITNMLKGLEEEEKEQGDGWIRNEENEKPNEVAPDKKLKTSEGQQPHGSFRSPPDTPKASSDSNSNSDSDDSVIRAIKARKKKESEKLQSSSEPNKKDDDISVHQSTTTSSADKRASRDNSFSDSNAKRSRQSGSLSDATHQEGNSRRSGCWGGDSGDGGLDPIPRAGRPSRDGSSNSRERPPHDTPARQAAPQSQQQLKPSPGAGSGVSPRQKASIFSPERSPRTVADPSRGERGDEREANSWRSPRDRKQAEQLASKEKILPASTKSPAKSPALSRSFGETGSRSSPLHTHRSPAFGRSPARHSQHPLNKSLDSSKGDLTDPKLTITPNKSDNEPEEERPSIEPRKFSVDSKDSDGDSAKSSLPEGNVNGMADFSKEDSTDTLDYGDKVSDLRDSKSKDPAPAHKTDEGYVSAEKVQTVTPPILPNNEISAQDALSKQRELAGFPGFQSNVTSEKLPSKEADKSSLVKPNNRLSTDDSVSSLELGLNKPSSQSNAWSELERLSSQSSLQQHLLDEQRYSQMQQQRNLTEDQKVVEAMAVSQQQQQYEAFLSQMVNMQRKSGHEITQQQMAYAQQYMKDMAGYGKGLGQHQNLDILSQQINYQTQYNMSYQHYLQQVQAYGQGLNKKVQDQQDLQFLSAVQWQQQHQEAWQAYQRMGDLEKMTQGGLREMQNLLSQQGKGKFSQEQHAQFQKLQAEKRQQEERRKKQEEDEKRRLEEDKKRQEEEKRKQEEEKRRLEEEKRLEKLRHEEELKQEEEKKRRLEEEKRKLQEEMRRQEEDQQRANFERYSAQHQQYNQQQRGYDYLKQHQDFLNDGHRRQPNERDLVGQVQDQLGALTGHGQALFGLSKDQNSNKGVNNNKNEVNHRVRPTSPRTSCKVEESRRDQEQQKQTFPQPPNSIPSATPADTLPGFKPSIPSRDHKRQSHEFHLETTVDLKARDRATPQSVAGSDKDSHNSEPSGIPSCLLDSILETAKLPVWKPPDKTPDQQIASPAKPPVASPPKPAPVTSERDSSFDDLVRHIDASPRQKPHSSKSSKQRDHSASEAERSDYDNDNQTMGGVDYDDPYASSDDLPLRQRQVVNKSNNKKEEEKAPEPALTKRGTKVPCYAEKDEDSFSSTKKTEDPQLAMAKLKNQPVKSSVGRGRARGRPGRGGVFGRRSGPKYDQKAFEKVHKNLAGTDFDFEGEFDDDFGASPGPKEVPTSLKGFREQTKKAPIYMQEGKKDDNFDFEDEPNNDQIPPVLSDGEEQEAASKPKQKASRTKQRRGRGNLAERDDPDSPEPDADDSVSKGQVPKVSMSSRVSLPKISIPREDMPKRATAAGEDSEALPKKIPTLKIKIGRMDSPVSVGSDEAEFKSKKHRRGSLERAKSKEERKSSVDDDDVTLQKVPKLKIKLGQPPPSKVPDRDPMETSFPPMAELTKEDIPPLLLRTTPTSSPRSAKGKVTPRPTPVEQTGGEHQGVSEPALEEEKEEDNDEKSLAPVLNTDPSPKKKSLGSIDSLATKLLAKQQSNSVSDKTSELNNIFGPEEPLQVNMGEEVANHQADRTDEGPSELELLAMELSNQLAKEKQMKQQKDEAERKEKEGEPGMEDDESIRHHDPKYKFKQLNKPSHSENRSSTSPGPPTPVKINLNTSSVADSNPLRRMRKKELLNQYYGIETVVPVSEAGTNGPALAALPEAAVPEMVPYRAPVKMNIMREPPIRNIIKMPKAVASVTSVPTRADYQSQLEANLERKRKREGKEPLPGKGKKGGKLKKEEKEYKPKIKMNLDDEDAEGDGTDKVRRTRGKPPKKRVVEESDEEDDPKVSFIESKKNESLKYAEELLANFDDGGGEEDKPDRGKQERRKEKKQKRRREEEDAGSQPNTKTPRIVIKFSKNKDPAKNIPKDNNGLTKPPVQKAGDSDMQKKLPKLKIKNLIEPNPS